MSGGRGLVWLEFRRGVGPLVAVLVGAGTVAVTRMLTTGGVVLWREVSEGLQYSTLVTGPIMAAAGAWAAARTRRAGIVELATTCPRSEWEAARRTLAVLVVAGLVGQAVAAGSLFLWAQRRATWGAPNLELVAVAATALVACVSFGWVVGRLLPKPITAPAVAILTYATIGAPAYRDDALRFLSPISLDQVPIFWELDATVGWHQATWFAALTVTFLALIATVGTMRRWTGVLATVAAVVVTGALAGGFVGRSPDHAVPAVAQPPDHCEEGTPVRVCVHPAYAAVLDEVALAATAVTAPLVAAGMAPTEVRQDAHFRATTLPDGAVVFPLAVVDGRVDIPATATRIALATTGGGCDVGHGHDDSVPEPLLAQWAVAGVLATDAGYPLWDQVGPEAEAAAAGLHALAFEERSRWLAANLDDVRRCRLDTHRLPA